MSYALRQIEIEGRTLERGSSSAGLICPFCEGGINKDKSFSITKKPNGNLVYYCHRAKCNRTGVISPSGSHILAVHTKTKKHKTFTDPTVPLEDAHLEFFQHRYDLEPEEIGRAGFLWVPNREAVYQPVYGPTGRIRGCVIRRYQDKKLNSYKASEELREPLISWYRPHDRPYDATKVVIVEDQLSAIKLSRYHLTLALLGTNMSAEAVMEILQNTSSQVLMLDKDAIGVALAERNRWKSVLNMEVMETRRDPKYWDDYQLSALDESETPL